MPLSRSAKAKKSSNGLQTGESTAGAGVVGVPQRPLLYSDGEKATACGEITPVSEGRLPLFLSQL